MSKQWMDIGNGWEIRRFTHKDGTVKDKWGATWFKFRHKSGINGESSVSRLHAYLPAPQYEKTKFIFAPSFLETETSREEQTISEIAESVMQGE